MAALTAAGDGQGGGGYDQARLAAIDWEREKVMLFIDGEVPQHDIAAGYFIVFEYLKIFLDNGYKVIFWPFNRIGVQPYTDELQQLGIEVIHGDASFDDFIRTWGEYIDISIVCRPEIASRHLDPIAEHSPGKIIYWAIDLYYLRQSRQAELTGSREEMDRALAVKAEEIANMRKADASLFFNPREVELVRREDAGINAHCVPWIQPLNVSPEARPAFAGRSGLLFLGGFRHNPNTDAVTWFHEEILPGVKKMIPDLETSIAGSHPPPEIRELDGADFHVLGFVEDLDSLMSAARVFIVPLRFGAGFKGKIAMAQSYGLPVVTTEVGAEGMGLRDGETALIADDAGEYAAQVARVYNDPGLWDIISRNSIRHVATEYSPGKAEAVIMDIIESLAAGTGATAFVKALWDRIRSVPGPRN